MTLAVQVSRFGFLVFALLAPIIRLMADPQLTSWQTANAAQYARVYETASDKTSGNAVSTWPRSGLTNGGGGQATPAYSDVQRVAYSANYVYIYTSGLASYTMGNWVTPNNLTYTSWPTNRAAIHRIPRTPSIPTTKQKNNGNGGVLVNGVYVWQNGDAQSYSTSSATVSMSGDGIWNRLAGVAEAFNFDAANGHQPTSGAYHNHVNPKALRYQLGDNVTYNSSTKTYSESGTPTKHSPIIGWANDGLPIYGPYGYATATNAASGVRRMVSGFVKRDGTNGTDNLTTIGRTKLPVWAASVQARSQTLSSTQYGPSTTTTYAVGGGVTSTYSIGVFAEDYEYLGDLGKIQGTDFDLNRQNVRFCVTPEFPSGTYAYFTCIDASGATVFPDIINQEYFGTASPGQGTVTSITEAVTDYVKAGPAEAITLMASAATSGSGVVLLWNSAEGATYKVESSSDSTTWTTVSSAVTSGGLVTSYTTTAAANYFRVTLTALATYDTGGTYGTPVGTTATVSYGSGGTTTGGGSTGGSTGSTGGTTTGSGSTSGTGTTTTTGDTGATGGTGTTVVPTMALTSAAVATVAQGHSVSMAATSSTGIYQWQVSANGTNWTNLSDGVDYTGTTTSTLTIARAALSLSGNSYRATTTGAGVMVATGSVILTVYQSGITSPHGLAVDSSDTLWVTDNSANTVTKIATSGATTAMAGTAGTVGSTDGNGVNARFNQPTGVVLTANGDSYIADFGNGLIRKITASGVVSTLAGSTTFRGTSDGAGSAATFIFPAAITRATDGTLYVADVGSHTIRRVTAAGVVTTLAGSTTAGALDGVGTAARFSFPRGITTDAGGNVYVADTGNGTIRKITATGVVTTLAGLAGASGWRDGAGADALFSQPEGIVADASGNLYVADTGNSIIRKITPAGVVTTLAGLPSFSGLKDGTGTAAWFSRPTGLAITNAGVLYVADTGNAAIRKITVAGEVSAVAIAASSTTTGSSGTSTTASTGSNSGNTDSGAGSSGGGGAPSHWFLAALVFLVGFRQRILFLRSVALKF